jgi:hypothetical protein
MSQILLVQLVFVLLSYLHIKTQSVDTFFDIFVMVGCFMVFDATFYNISVISLWSVLLVQKIGVSGENH